MSEEIANLNLAERERVVQHLLALADLCARASAGPVDRDELVLAAITANDDAKALMVGVFYAPAIPTEDRAIVGATP